VEQFLLNNRLILLIDNLSFDQSQKYRLNKLTELLHQYPNIILIATSTQTIEGQIPLDVYEYSDFIQFKAIMLKYYRSAQIRQLTEKWFSKSNVFDTTEKIEKIIQFLLLLDLPRTPLAISMFLWILEKQEDYKPINQATMLENFIEQLFKKHSKKEIYFSSFDFRNKERLLTALSYYMFEKGGQNYSVKYSELLTFIEKYLKVRKFEFNATMILNHFLERGVLIKENIASSEYIRFRFNCFFQYFLMKKIDYDEDFLSYVMDESHYLAFSDEIDYYTGIKRDKVIILNILIDRINHEYKQLIDEIESFPHSYDTVFEKNNSIAPNLNGKFINKLKDKREGAKKRLVEIKDRMLEEMKPKFEIEKKIFNLTPFQKLERMWTLAARVLRNTEEVEDESVKEGAFESVLRCSLAFTVIYEIILCEYFESEKNKIPKSKKEQLKLFSNFLPLIHESSLYELLATSKLDVVIREYIESNISNKTISDFAKFVSVFLYADGKGRSYFDYVKQLIKKAKHKYIYDMLLFKIVSYYFFRSSEDTDIKYENLIGDIIVNSRGLKKKEKYKIMQDFKKKKKEIKGTDRQLKFDI